MGWILFRGRRACSCIIGQTQEVERLLGHSLRFYQMGYNAGGVAASASTHDAGGCSDTLTMSVGDQRIARRTGGTFWNRTRAQGFSYHNHNNVIGCPHMSSGARWQVSEYVNFNHNGLAGRGRDDGPAVKKVKWSDYKAARDRAVAAAKTKAAKAEAAAQVKRLRATPIVIAGRRLSGISAVTVTGVVAARKARRTSRYTYLVQKALRDRGLYLSPLDGKWGPVTQKAYDTWRKRNGWPDVVTGPPGLTSLKKLFAQVKSPYPVRK